MSSAICTIVPSSHLRKNSSHGSIGLSQPKIPWRSRISASLSVKSWEKATDDVLFRDYKPSCAFFFPGQGAQNLGMSAEAQRVEAAAELFRKANDILDFDLLDACTNGPKDKLDSTVISQGRSHLRAITLILVQSGVTKLHFSV